MELITSKIIALTLLGTLSIFFGLLPLKLKTKLLNDPGKDRTRRRRERVVSALLCFGAGVLLATVFIHMLPETRENVALARQMGLIGSRGQSSDEIPLSGAAESNKALLKGDGIHNHDRHHDNHDQEGNLQSSFKEPRNHMSGDLHFHHGDSHSRGRSPSVLQTESSTEREHQHPTSGNSFQPVSEHVAHDPETSNHGHHIPEHVAHESEIFNHEHHVPEHVPLSENISPGTQIGHRDNEHGSQFDSGAESQTSSSHTGNDAELLPDHGTHLISHADKSHDNSEAHVDYDHDETDFHAVEHHNKDIPASTQNHGKPGQHLVHEYEDHEPHTDHEHRSHESQSAHEHVSQGADTVNKHGEFESHEHHNHEPHAVVSSVESEHDSKVDAASEHSIPSSRSVHSHRNHEVRMDHGLRVDHSSHISHIQASLGEKQASQSLPLSRPVRQAQGEHSSHADHGNAPDDHGHDEEAATYPLAELLICAGFFLIYFVEEFVHKILFQSDGRLGRKKTKLVAAIEEGLTTPPVRGIAYSSYATTGHYGKVGSHANGVITNHHTAGLDETTHSMKLPSHGQSHEKDGSSNGSVVEGADRVRQISHSRTSDNCFSKKSRRPEDDVVMNELRCNSVSSPRPLGYENPGFAADEADSISSTSITPRAVSTGDERAEQLQRASSAPASGASGGHGHSHSGISRLGSKGIIGNLRSLLIVLALSFHAVFEGLAVGLQERTVDVWYLFGAISAHKFVIAFCVGLELLAGGTALLLMVIYMLIFALVTPLGVAIGIIVTSSTMGSESSSLLAITILQGFAGGTILYVTFFEVLERERSKSGSRFLKLLFLFLGFSAMAALEAVGAHKHGHSVG